MSKILNTISKVTGRSGLLIKKHSPEILMAVGVVGVVASTVMACKATLKADEVIDAAKEKIDRINEAKELDTEYAEEGYKKDLALTYAQTGVDFAKLYGPAVLVGVASIGCLLGAHGIMKKRNVALVAAYKAVEQSFSDYRKRVVEKFGDEQDRKFKFGVIETEVTTEAYTDENGKKHKAETKKVESIDPNGISQYARFFDEYSVQWSKTPEYNLTFLKCQQNYANDLLKARGHVFLNEVYDMLGIPRSQAGAIVGWVNGEGDDFVDFGIFKGDTNSREFVNGFEGSILLDFNVAGVIYDMI